ncbi:MAG TPA: heparinase II/III family protein [Rhodopila sp.]|uniref:heparinase II/III family protein n=1 Tax=Rhodopila sp. TaxID=2480087 RepID=UPI002C2D45BB|nr:heparinase II/III family protein [Rhodopila sp.]HVY17361.1 heparinase II/III family protein [Rhodopila sp.]
MSGTQPRRWLRGARLAMARLPTLRMGRVPDAPALSVRDPWPGDPTLGARLLKGELVIGNVVLQLQPNGWGTIGGSPVPRAITFGFTWLRDLRALGTDAARLRARGLVADWIANPPSDPIASRPDVIGARITAWLGHYDFFAATADDGFRQRLMGRLVQDARSLSAALPAEELDARALTAMKGLVAAAVTLREHTGLLTRALRFLPQEIARQVLPDGSHAERSPAAQLQALQDLTEIRALLQTSQTQPPPALAAAIDRMAPALRMLRHGDGGLALFNGASEGNATQIDIVLTQAGRGGRSVSHLPDGGFHRLQAGRSVLIVDCGTPPPPGLDRLSHAGTLSMELSIGRDRLIVNCGAFLAGPPEWHDAARSTAAHSTLVIADVNSSELKPEGLGRRPTAVEVQRQEAAGAHWLDVSHDGWKRSFNAIHRRRLYVAESGEDIRGEDLVESPEPQPFTLRFHLHPDVQASLQQDGGTVLLRLKSGSFWRLRADGARLNLEETIYLGGPEPRRAEQIVLTGFADGPQQVKWALSKVERGG